MESLELCARISRLVRADGAAPASPSPTAWSGEVRAALDAVVAFYDDNTTTQRDSAIAGVDDMILLALQRLLLTTLRKDCDIATQERAFVGVALLLRRSLDCLPLSRIVELLQAAVLYLPTPAAVVDATTTPWEAKTSEELVLAVLETLQLLLSAPAAAPAVHHLIQSQDSVHFLAYVVSCLLQLAERERHRGLAVLAVHVLKTLVKYVAVDSRVLRMFFPGVSVGMWKTMSAPLQSSKVVVAALECLSCVISACLHDQKTSDDDGVPQYSIERLRQVQNTPETATARTDDWLVQAVDKVDLLLSHILSSSAMDRQPWRVRRALVELCAVVFLDCRQSLSTSFFRCFEELMVLRSHAIPDVAHAAQEALERLTHTLPAHEWIELEPQFAERFQMQLSTLELQCGTEHESVSIHTMEVLIGYLQFQKQRFRSVLDDAMITIFKALGSVLAFDGFNIDLLRHERQNALVLPYFQKRFRHFYDEVTVSVAMRLLRNFGAVATPAVIVDTAVTILQTEEQEDRARRDAILVILNECLRAQVSEVAIVQDNIHLAGRLLDDLLALPLWVSTRSQDKNTTALLVECIGVGVDLCGSAFKEFLLYVLYPLVEKLGDNAIQVEQAALTTLQKIASTCGHDGDLHALFSANMDYLVDALCARLEQLELYPQSPQVVEALLRYATVASLPLIDEITRSLLRAVDLYQDSPETTTTLLRSLQLLLGGFASKSNESEDAQFSRQATDTISPLSRFLLEMQAMTEPLTSEMEKGKNVTPVDTSGAEALMKSAMPIEYDADEGDDQLNGENMTSSDDEKELPPLPFQTQTVEILERCSYFVSEADSMTCCLVLATIEQGIRHLRPRRKELLPLIHRIWPSILHRLTVSNRPILTATMKLLTTLAECAGDFIGDRFVETVWPSVKIMLQSIVDTAGSSEGQRTPSLTRSMLRLSMADSNASAEPTENNTDAVDTTVTIYRDQRMTLETKLVMATLRCLRVVCENAVTVTAIVPEITDTCSLLLSPSFGESTVVLAQELMLTLAGLNGDEVFVAMASLSQWQPPAPPSSRFPVYDSSVSEPRTISPDKRDQARRHQEQFCRANATFVLDQLVQRRG